MKLRAEIEAGHFQQKPTRIEDPYRGVLIVWHGPNIIARTLRPHDTPDTVSMVSLVHRQFGTVWHDEVGHTPHGPGLHGPSDWLKLFVGTGLSSRHDCNNFFIRVYTDDESARKRYTKQPNAYQWEFAIDGLLAENDRRHHGSSAAAAQQLYRS